MFIILIYFMNHLLNILCCKNFSLCSCDRIYLLSHTCAILISIKKCFQTLFTVSSNNLLISYWNIWLWLYLNTISTCANIWLNFSGLLKLSFILSLLAFISWGINIRFTGIATWSLIYFNLISIQNFILYSFFISIIF